jgi:hypothetical protein
MTLFELLPTVYRLRDVDNGGALEALVGLIDSQAELLRADLEGLWDDLFIETCNEWVVPYIGDLVANTPLYEVPGVGRRADVADTIHWRRRKGTLAMLGDLARHVTGWKGTAVAMFELLSWNQNLNHVRMLPGSEDPRGLHGGLPHPLVLDRVGTVDLRDRDCVDRIGTAWDEVCHTVDVRRGSDQEGWYGIKKVCFFCFRLTSYPMRRIDPAAASPAAEPLAGTGCYRFSPLGQDAPVFHQGVALPAGQDFAQEENADAAIRPYRFYRHPELDWGQSLGIEIGGTAVPVSDVLCKDLSQWTDPDSMVAVDVRTGRIRVGSSYPLTGALKVDACYGFSAGIGGGPYPRPNAPTAPPTALHLEVGPGKPFVKLEDAIGAWTGGPPQDAVITVVDSATYTPAGGVLDLSWPALASPVGLTIVAADQQRPTIVGALKVANTLLHELVLDGLLISGTLDVAGPVQEVSLTDCTLVPGLALNPDGSAAQPDTPSFTADAPADARTISFDRCITGPLRIAVNANHLQVSDSIIDAPVGATHPIALAGPVSGAHAGPESTLQRVTVFGSVHVRELTLASDCIFVEGSVRADRRQAGCMRFCSLQLQGPHTPRRYRCQPDLVRAGAAPADVDAETLRVHPGFTSRHYGQPGYAQLERHCADEIKQGADDRAEMGAFHLLLQPFRETNLRVRLDEYLPFGLEPVIVHVT